MQAIVCIIKSCFMPHWPYHRVISRTSWVNLGRFSVTTNIWTSGKPNGKWKKGIKSEPTCVFHPVISFFFFRFISQPLFFSLHTHYGQYSNCLYWAFRRSKAWYLRSQKACQGVPAKELYRELYPGHVGGYSSSWWRCQGCYSCRGRRWSLLLWRGPASHCQV